MRPKELKDLLVTCIKAGLPVLIKGQPGVGKSDIVEQAAAECKADFILRHPVVEDPTDYKGAPAVLDGKADFLPFGDLRALMLAKKLTVCMIDDLGQAAPVVQAAAMQLILARRINGHKISDKVIFISATNRREDKAGVTSILEPVKSRFATIVQLDVNVDDWCEWALQHDVPPELVAFIRFRPQLLSDWKPTNDIVNGPCPRTVARMGQLYAAGVRTLEPLAGAVGQGFATEFLGFIRVWQSLPSIDGILIDPTSGNIPDSPAALYAIVSALSGRATAANADRIVRYARRLPEEFGVLLVRDLIRVCPTATSCKEFIAWATEHQDALS